MSLLDIFKTKKRTALEEYRAILQREVDGATRARDGERLMELVADLGFSMEVVARHLEALRRLRDIDTQEPRWMDAEKLLEANEAAERAVLELDKQFGEIRAAWMSKLEEAKSRKLVAYGEWHQAFCRIHERESVMKKHPDLFPVAEATAAAK